MLCYLDNAATSFPKPETVYAAVLDSLQSIGNPGRGGHFLSLKADRVLFDARERVSRFFNVPQSKNVVFSKNATESVNLALKGLLQPGDHVVASGVEHNAVMRPLESLKKRGITYTNVACSPQGFLDPADLAKAIRPNTRLVALTHAFNVTGTILPIREIGQITRDRNITFLVDAAQTAGVLEIHMERDGIDLLACTGHKGLLGPQGIGFLCIGEGIHLEPLIEGGTGSRSDSISQPHCLPDCFESGTQNTPGIAGLSAGIAFIEKEGLQRIREKEKALTQRMLQGLMEMDGVEIFGPCDADKQTAVVSFRIEGMDPGETGDLLEQEFGVITRVGLHCSPLGHKTLGTYPTGTLRASPGFFTKESEIDYFLDSLRDICERVVKG